MNDDTPWRDCPLAVVDVETTGLDPKVDRVIEIAIVHMQAGEVTHTFSSLVNPERELPKEVVALTKITPEDLDGAPRFAEVAEQVREHLQGRVFVAYNLAFDRAFLVNELGRVGLEIPEAVTLDPLVFVRELHKKDGSKKLVAVAERLGISLDNAHRAAADAEATGHVLYRIADKLPTSLGDLAMLQQQWERQQKIEMARWRNRGRDRSIEAELGTAPTRERGNSLGPAYVYGEETDPVRAMFKHLPDSGGRRG